MKHFNAIFYIFKKGPYIFPLGQIFTCFFSFSAAGCKDVQLLLPSLLGRWSRGWGCCSAGKLHTHSRSCCNSSVGYSLGGWPALPGVTPGGLPVTAAVNGARKTPSLLCRLRNSFRHRTELCRSITWELAQVPFLSQCWIPQQKCSHEQNHY